MHLFARNRNVDFLSAIQSILIQYQAGTGIQSIIQEMSKGSGRLAPIFRKILRYNSQGLEIGQAITETAKKTEDNNTSHLLNSLKLAMEGDIDLGYVLGEIEEHIMQDQKIVVEKFINRTNKVSMAVLYVMISPLVYLALLVANWVSISFYETGVIFDREIRLYLMFALTGIFLLITMFLRYDP